ncbi:MAG: LysE family transporter [Chloroflexi bacterium]|nr:LysE family transporter [Chloroflexota bacterium]
MFFYLTQGLILGGTAAAQPGPFQAYLLSQTLKNGWRRTLWATFAPLLSDGPIIALVLLVLTQTPDWFLNLLRIGGGLFLLYLAWGAYKVGKTAVSSQPPPPSTSHQNIFEAALMNALSPNPYIFWATVAGPILIEGWRQSPLHGLSFVAGFYGTLIGGFMGFVALFAIAQKLDDRLNRFLSIVSAVVLCLFGLYQLIIGITSWVTG